MPKLFAGIDCSTQSCKLVILDFQEAAVIYTDIVNYDNDLPQYGSINGVIPGLGAGISESDPNMWIDALNMLFTRLKDTKISTQDILAISVSGQQHGLVTLDAEGNLTRKHSKLWNDFSTTEECQLMTEAVGGVEAMINEVGNSQRTGYTAAKIFHLARHEPEAFAKTTTCFLVHNFVNWYLTGAKNNGVRVMEPGDTSGIALWHTGKRTWSTKLCQIISPDLMDKIPQLRPSDEMIGTISPELCRRYGFSPQCQIDAGSGDNMYGAVGTGNVCPGIVTISLGTSGTAYSFMKQPFIDREGEIAAFCDSTGNFLPLLCVSNLSNGYNAILKQYDLDHSSFNKIASITPPGCNGRLIVPWYEGERTPNVPLAAPIYFGFKLSDFKKEWLCRSVLEGHILNLYEGFKRMPIQAREIRLTGGLAQSDVWRQAIADIFEVQTVPVEGEGAALGAALHAAWVYQKKSDNSRTLQDIATPFIKLREDKRQFPNLKNVNIYRQLKKIYSSISSRIRGLHSSDDPFQLRNELCMLIQK